MLYRWQAPGPYRVAFSTRLGGVSEGAVRLAQPGRAEPATSRSACSRTAPGSAARWRSIPSAATMALQQHGAVARPAEADGPARKRAGLPRVRRALERGAGAGDAARHRRLPAGGDRPRGRRAAGAGAGSRRLARACSRACSSRRCGRSASGTTAAVLGPAIGPCCFEVGDEIAARFRRRFGRRGRERAQGRSLAGGRAGAGRGRLHAASSGSRSAPPAIRSCSSRTGATGVRPGARE